MRVDKGELRALVTELLQRKGEAKAASDETPLVSSGLLDSVDVLEIVSFLETRYGLDFAARPFDPTDFDSLDNIVRMIESFGRAV